MKIQSLFAVVPLFFAMSASAVTSPYPTYKVSCAVNLIGNTSRDVSAESQIAIAPASPSVSFNLGDYQLNANLVAANRDASDPFSFEPVLNVTLFRNGQGPIVGQINFATISGFKDLAVGQSSSTLSSASFLTLQYDGVKYSRVDYQCKFSRAQ